MEKKRPTVLIGIFYVIIGVLLLMLFFPRHSFLHFTPYDITPLRIFGYFVHVLLPFIILISGIGLFLFRNWARKIAIFVSFFPLVFAFQMSIGMINRDIMGPLKLGEPTTLEYIWKETVHQLRIISLVRFDEVVLIGLIISILIGGPIIFYLTRPKVKEQFK